MGNTALCAPYTSGSIRVIDGDGRIEQYLRSVRAAELMVENPGQFVCDSNHLRVGCRIPGLAAEAELERHSLYFLLPMDMLYSVLTEEEMAALACKATGAMKRGVRSTKNIGRRILPVLSDHFCLFPAEAKQQVQAKEPARSAVNEGERMLTQRSWKPALDTIEEVP